MKILRIELQNINSLKSGKPFVVDFEDEKFRDVGLFAITGSTGAGKTTILDAITIALYQSVPRFNNPGVKAGLTDVVSYGAEDAMARVTFRNKDQKYEAQWNIRLTSKTGKILGKPKEEVRLKNLTNGKILAEKKTDFQYQIEKIIQLNYKQFLRSVMLAQGEFAAFLSADANEKGNLLEQITGEEIYKKIGETLNAKIYSERHILEKIKSKINTEDLLSDEIRTSLKMEQLELAGKISETERNLAGILTIINWFKRNDELEKKQLQLETDRVKLNQLIDEKKGMMDKLALHEKAEPFKPTIDELKRTETRIGELEGKSKKLIDDLTTINSELEKATALEAEKKRKHNDQENELKLWLPRLEKVAEMDADIKNNNAASHTASEKIKGLVNALSGFCQKISDKQTEKTSRESELKAVNAFLDENKSIPEMEKELTRWSAVLTSRRDNHRRIFEGKKEIKTHEIDNNTLSTRLQEAEKKFKTENTKLDQLHKEVVELSNRLKSFNLDVLLKNQSIFDKNQTLLEQQQSLSLFFVKLTATKEKLGQEKLALEKEKAIVDAGIEKLTSQITHAEKALADAEKILDLERTIQSFDEERKKLVKGEPCALCGSTAHPYVEHYKTARVSESRREAETRKEKLENLKSEEQQLKIKSAEVKTKLDSIVESLSGNQSELDQTIRDYAALNTLIPIHDADHISELLHNVRLARKKGADEIADAQNLQKQKDEKSEKLSEEKEVVNKLENEIVRIQEQLDGGLKTLDEKNRNLKILSAETATSEAMIKEELFAFRLEIPPVENTDSFINQLKKRVTDFDMQKENAQKLSHIVSQINADIKNFEEQISEKTREQESLQKELQILLGKLKKLKEERHSMLPGELSTDKKRQQLHDNIDEAKKAFEIAAKHVTGLNTRKATNKKEAENNALELDNQKTHLSKHLGLLEKMLSTSEFESRLKIESALLDIETKTHFSQTKKLLDDKTLELKTLAENLKAELEKQLESKDFDITLEQAQARQQEIDVLKKKLSERVGEIKKQFDLDNQIKARNKSVVEEIDQQEKILKKYTDLLALLGGSKDAFNKYVQRLTLQNLIHFANIHLFKLNRRYSLKMNETYKSGEELNFMLVDHYQTDEARYVDTSSGGEKFLISLALALGLSDLASNNVNIESLFIDEGFGTLDNNTLETVISTLETLQAQGKMIGIISHVENLKERIPTQIQVLKKTNGVSEVVII